MRKNMPWSFMADTIQTQIRPEEDIVWRGQPELSFIIAAYTARMVLWWSVIIGCIAVAIYISWWLLLPFLPAFVLAAWRLDNARTTFEKDRGTRYAVTNRRALITQDRSGTAVETFSPGEIEQVEFRNSRFGVTDVLFNHEIRGAKFGPDAHVKVISTGFLRIRDHEGARVALEAISDVEPRHRIPPGRLKLINITPAILK